ncbi:DUF4347 domain-containing protein [Marinobacter sp. C2H3]|uniref:DUF4347 domain-containing protein n=1 Tax=Marinobacter sp. C2H3 TaxID=3119003 RepID=UPI00300EBB0B
MKKHLLTGLPSLLLPLGLCGVPVQASTGYARSYLSAERHLGKSLGSNLGLAPSALRSAGVLPVPERSGAMEPARDDVLGILSAQPVRELLVIDGAVPDKTALYRAVKPGIAVVELRRDAPGLAQLAEVLRAYRNLSALHIVSHADNGRLFLGNSSVDAAALRRDVSMFNALHRALAPSADVLFYGCDLAQGDKGAEFLDLFQQKARVNLAASDDFTGGARQQGDWDLEITRGDVHATLPFSARAIADYSAVLAPFTGTIEFDNAVNVGQYGSTYNGYSKGDGSINATFQAGSYVIVFDGQKYSTAARNYGPPATYGYTSEGESAATLYFQGHPAFTANSINLVNASGSTETFTITGGAGGVIPGITIVNGDNQTIDLSSLSASTTSVTVTVDDGNGYFYVDRFTVTGVGAPVTPTVTDGNIAISGASGTGGAYRIGDTVTATWDNSAGGDNNTGVTGVTMDFSSFGGGSAVAATESSGVWTATYTLVSGTVDATNRNVSVTATNSAGSTTTADTTNATVDNVAPTVTDGKISISGGSGTGGAFKIGDTVTATWNNTAAGDNNADASSVTVDFSAFGGGSAVVASNSSGTWTATYTLTAGAIDATNRNVSVSVTDNAGNSTTAADTSNATVDTLAPVVTDANISISGGTGSSGTYLIGDTVTATWNNTAGGDNNSDTISSATVDFSQFGGGSAVAATNSAGTWTATYTLVAGSIEASGRNVSVSATDNAGNRITRADTSNAYVDNAAPTVGSVSVPANATYIAGQNLDFTVNIASANDVVVDTAGGTPRIALTVGSTTRYADYVSGSASPWLVFRYTIQSGDLDSNGIAVSGSIDANGGTLRDGSGNPLNLALNNVGSTASVLVDGVVPEISSVTVPASGTYVTGEVLSFTVNTSENATVNTAGGTPYLPLTLGASPRNAQYVSGSGTTALSFQYTVQAGDDDSDGIDVGTSLALNGGTIKDAAANDLSLALSNVGDTSGVNVDTAAPTLQSLSPMDDAAAVASNTALVMTFSEDIALGTGNIVIYDSANTPVATIDVASAGGQLTVTGNTLTIQPASALAENASYYVLVGSTAVKDLAGTAYAGIADSTAWNFTVADVTAPTATLVVADNELLTGETSLVTITFDEAVTGFSNADLTVANGTLSNVASSDGGITWTATLTPTENTYVAGNVITLDNAGVMDASNNVATGTTDSNDYTVRTKALTLQVTSNLDTGDDETIGASLADDEADGSGLSLREALAWARSGGDTVTFDLDSGTDGSQGGTITLNGNSLDIQQPNLRINGDVDGNESADVTISAGGFSRVLSVDGGMAGIVLNGLILTDGSAIGGGGGLALGSGASATLSDSGVTNSVEVGAGGGGIYSFGATLTLIRTTVSGNHSDSYGGGIRVLGAGVLHLFDSTVSGNAADGAGAEGGGIQFQGTDLRIVNTTISGNAALGTGSIGGGLRIASGNAAVYNTTIVGNAAADSAGGVSANGIIGRFFNSVVAGNTSGATAAAATGGSALATGDTPDDVAGTLEEGRNNYFGTLTTLAIDTGNLNEQGTDSLLLGTLAQVNGAGVPVHQLQEGSALWGAGSNAALPADSADLDGDSKTAEPLPLDATGAPRIVASSVDIGAVEGSIPLPLISGSPTTTIAVGSAYRFTPLAKDVYGQPLTFSISHRPSWASFDAATGQLSGTPGAGDVGATTNIVISVSNGDQSASLPAFELSVTATSDTANDLASEPAVGSAGPVSQDSNPDLFVVDGSSPQLEVVPGRWPEYTDDQPPRARYALAFVDQYGQRRNLSVTLDDASAPLPTTDGPDAQGQQTLTFGGSGTEQVVRVSPDGTTTVQVTNGGVVVSTLTSDAMGLDIRVAGDGQVTSEARFETGSGASTQVTLVQPASGGLQVSSAIRASATATAVTTEHQFAMVPSAIQLSADGSVTMDGELMDGAETVRRQVRIEPDGTLTALATRSDQPARVMTVREAGSVSSVDAAGAVQLSQGATAGTITSNNVLSYTESAGGPTTPACSAIALSNGALQEVCSESDPDLNGLNRSAEVRSQSSSGDAMVSRLEVTDTSGDNSSVFVEAAVGGDGFVAQRPLSAGTLTLQVRINGTAIQGLRGRDGLADNGALSLLPNGLSLLFNDRATTVVDSGTTTFYLDTLINGESRHEVAVNGISTRATSALPGTRTLLGDPGMNGPAITTTAMVEGRRLVAGADSKGLAWHEVKNRQGVSSRADFAIAGAYTTLTAPGVVRSRVHVDGTDRCAWVETFANGESNTGLGSYDEASANCSTADEATNEGSPFEAGNRISVQGTGNAAAIIIETPVTRVITF